MAKTIDARGQVCPKPLIMTKQALREAAPGEKFTLLTDNETSRKNVERFLSDTRTTFVTSRQDDVHSITVTKASADLISPSTEDCCTPSASKPHIVVISSERMGQGPEDLGEILMKAFVNTINEVQPLPSAVLLYNGGVRLVVDGSPLIEPMKELEKRGVQILCCGTCLDFYGVKQTLRVGEITNMYVILEKMTEAGHIVRP